MITFKDNGSAVSILFSDEQRYLYDGEMNVPKGSLSLVYDNSGMAIFRRSSNNDVLFECFPSDTNLGNKSALTEFFTTSMVGEGVDLSDYYTKEEADAAIESAITESGSITSGQVESQIESALTAYTTTSDLNTLLNNKQDTLVSGTNIKTINNQSLLGEGNITIEGGGGESYTAGNGITIAEGVISVDSNVVPSMDEVVDNDTYTAFTASTSSDISNLEKQDTALGGEIASHEQAFTAYTAATNATLANKANRSEIPSLDGYATESWVEGKGYVTNADMTAYTYSKSAIDSMIGDVETLLSQI